MFANQTRVYLCPFVFNDQHDTPTKISTSHLFFRFAEFVYTSFSGEKLEVKLFFMLLFLLIVF